MKKALLELSFNLNGKYTCLQESESYNDNNVCSDKFRLLACSLHIPLQEKYHQILITRIVFNKKLCVIQLKTLIY